jgi:hypothetical protein
VGQNFYLKTKIIPHEINVVKLSRYTPYRHIGGEEVQLLQINVVHLENSHSSSPVIFKNVAISISLKHVELFLIMKS